ncbi:MAG TPA: nucleoside monophosphate kinase, partial [Acidimicrobiales bacterium]
VPDDLMIAVVAAALGDHADDGYVLDGFPRTLPQAEAVVAPGSPFDPADLAVHITLPDRVVHDRLEQRAEREGRADDADPAVVDRRLLVYREETEPLLDHYSRQGKLVTVDGDQAPEDVTADIVAALTARRAVG